MSEIDYSKLPPECDWLCQWRDCLRRGEDKGSFTPGRGYTSYHRKSRYVCLTRHCHGCPDGPVDETRTVRRPEPNWEAMISDLAKEVRDARCTRKVRRLTNRLLNGLHAVLEYRRLADLGAGTAHGEQRK